MYRKHHETHKGTESRNGFVEKGTDLPSPLPGMIRSVVSIISVCKNRDPFYYTYSQMSRNDQGGW